MKNTLMENDSDDSELLARRLREAKNSPRKPYVPGEFRKLATQAIAASRRRKRSPSSQL